MLIFPREIRILSGTRLWRHSCDILVKHLAIFRLCSESLSEAELKSNGLVCLAEEVLRQDSIQAVSWSVLTARIQAIRERASGGKRMKRYAS